MIGLRTRFSAFSHLRKPSGSFRLVGLSILIGVATGLMVAGIQQFVVFAQRAMLGFAAERRIALPDHASYVRIALALVCSAILVTVLSRLTAYWRTKDPIDAVEANALSGGRMSWYDATAVVIPILASVSFGASVGIEAAVTQLGAVLASRLGRRLNKPRSDLRLLVGVGSAAAIAAAYRAPIAGMLYAYELVLGTYSKRTLAPIGIGAISAVLMIWLVSGPTKPFSLEVGTNALWSDYPLAVLIGGASAFMGIAVMLLVSATERILKRFVGDETLRRVAAGLLLTLLSMRFPAVLGSGHAAIEHAVNGDIAGRQALGLLAAKGLASAASLGAGFRGGLFSASLMMGALLGQVFAWLLPFVPGAPPLSPALGAVIGMASVGASVIGSPLAMIFLVLETTGDFDATIVVAIGAISASFLTDRLFGYSFATWRFQQRGLAIEGGHDVSRLETTAISDIIRPPKRAVAVNAGLEDVRRAVSTAGARGTAVYSLNGSFAGLIDPQLVEALDAEAEDLPVVAAELVYETAPIITPRTTLAEVVDIFRTDDRPTLAVVAPDDRNNLIGCIRARDAFALASSLLDQQRREDLGIGALK
ncbi:chloride channel protein [Microvirga subterranea]|uniref:CIC family chloride channel protein n=1 Tax=Microvirga subterranea TaxID=186651 RepID=A0A370HN49_9HYPH|nr:chloride channel protein [Microvirga subterranea]RDI59992.1 CIC family chloride channel protein [Microvirga subterranea]